jgi:nicotinamidase-related amidase
MTERLDPKRSAFVIMDYQPDILKNVEAQVPTLLANAKKALAAARAAKMPIFHVKVAFRPGHPEVSPNNVGFSAAKSANRLVLGTPGAEIHPDVAAIDGEPTIVKHRISPMTDTELPTLLRARDVNHLVMCGVSTSGCILSSVRYAADQDYRMTIVEDCCADPDAEAHAFLMKKLYPKQCAVVTTDAFVASLK